MDLFGRKRLGPALLTVDDAERLANVRTQGTQLGGGQHDLTAASDDVLYDQHSAPGDVRAFSQATRSIRLGLLANKGAGKASVSAERGDDRDATHLEASQHLRVLRHERGHRLGDGIEENRVAFEAVLVEVLRGPTSRAEYEITGQMGRTMDLPSKI